MMDNEQLRAKVIEAFMNKVQNKMNFWMSIREMDVHEVSHEIVKLVDDRDAKRKEAQASCINPDKKNTTDSRDKIIKLINGISNNVYGISDYCNLKKPDIINYKKKEYPIDLIEKWSEDAKEQIDELEKMFKEKINFDLG